VTHQDVADLVLLKQLVVYRQDGASGVSEDIRDALIDERLDAIGAIKRKYGETAAAVSAYREEIARALDRIERHDAIVQEMQGEVERASEAAGREGRELSEARGEAAPRLERLIQRELRTLGMDHARFRVALRREMAGAEDLARFVPNFTIIAVPSFKADPETEGTRGETAILVHLKRMEVIIVGTEYAGEIKKSAFTVMNYLLPDEGVLPMHSAVNVGEAGDAAIFFGLSGTGKTTLSTDSERPLIGDDEHGWGESGVFNIEGGCYAKVIRLSPTAEPEIHATTHMFGSVLENVVISPDTRALNLDDASLTENTRGAYPIEFIDNAVPSGAGATSWG